jgi:hypothetical protein
MISRRRIASVGAHLRATAGPPYGWESAPKGRRPGQCRGAGLKNWRSIFHFLT